MNPPRRVPIELDTSASSKVLFDKASSATTIPASGMKLIYRGRIILSRDDDISVVEEFKIEEGSVIHCMGKPAEKPLPAAETSTSTSIPSAASTPVVASTVSTPSMPVAAPTPAAPSGPVTLQSSLAKIKSNHPAADYKTAVTTLTKLLSNVINNPMEEKYRKVKKSNAAFQKRLGSMTGADEAITSIGFKTVGEEYVLTPSPEAWPKLLDAKKTLDQALKDFDAEQAEQLQQQQQMRSNDMGFGSGMNSNNMGGMPNFNMPEMGGMGMPDPAMIQNMMSNPQMLQSMLQNPMVQQMMQNDPMLANNPMAQQQMRMLANNPQMLEQVSRMMSDPATMERMRNMMQTMRGGNGMGMGNMPAVPGTNASNTGTNSTTPDFQRQMEMMRQFASMTGANNGANSSSTSANNNATNGATSGQQQQNQANDNNNSNGGNGNGNNQQMTEEEMLAEAIARSLREQ